MSETTHIQIRLLILQFLHSCARSLSPMPWHSGYHSGPWTPSWRGSFRSTTAACGAPGPSATAASGAPGPSEIFMIEALALFGRTAGGGLARSGNSASRETEWSFSRCQVVFLGCLSEPKTLKYHAQLLFGSWSAHHENMILSTSQLPLWRAQLCASWPA